MQERLRHTIAKISLDNLRWNVRQLKKLQGEQKFFCPMVKANAYGHGAVPVARVLANEGATALGVATVEEGLQLRSEGILNLPILVFHPLLTAEAVQVLDQYELTPVVSSWASLQMLESKPVKVPRPIHIKFNTGMNRLGFPLPEVEKIKSFLATAQHVRLAAICTHLLQGEDFGADHSRTQDQLEKLMGLGQQFSQLPLHALNSSGLLALAHGGSPLLAQLGARPGISLYGIKPEIAVPNDRVYNRWQDFELRPVMSVQSQICHVQQVKKGETVSYGGNFRAERDSVIGVVAMGYADGYFRHFSGVGAMLWRGRRVPVAGTVCMDFTMIDLTEVCEQNKISYAEICGEPVMTLGQDGEELLKADDLARIIGTNPYEILTNISARVPRVYA